MFTPQNVSHVMCHVSRVMCHVSRVTCHLSRVTCHLSHVKHFFWWLCITSQRRNAFKYFDQKSSFHWYFWKKKGFSKLVDLKNSMKYGYWGHQNKVQFQSKIFFKKKGILFAKKIKWIYLEIIYPSHNNNNIVKVLYTPLENLLL